MRLRHWAQPPFDRVFAIPATSLPCPDDLCITNEDDGSQKVDVSRRARLGSPPTSFLPPSLVHLLVRSFIPPTFCVRAGEQDPAATDTQTQDTSRAAALGEPRVLQGGRPAVTEWRKLTVCMERALGPSGAGAPACHRCMAGHLSFTYSIRIWSDQRLYLDRGFVSLIMVSWPHSGTSVYSPGGCWQAVLSAGCPLSPWVTLVTWKQPGHSAHLVTRWDSMLRT